MNKLIVEIKTGYVTTGFKNLAGLGEYKWVNGQCYWYFPLEKLEEALKILGKSVEFDKDDVLKALSYCPPLKEHYILTPQKGKGFFILEHETPKYYTIRTIINKKEVVKDVPKDNVLVVWNAINAIEERQKKKRPIPAFRLAEEICKILRIDRFTRESGYFDFPKFFGSRSSGYFPLYYYPLKVLQAKGLVEYSKDGKTLKIGEKFDIQTRLER